MKVKAGDKRHVLVTNNVATDGTTAQCLERLEETTSEKRAFFEDAVHECTLWLQRSFAAAQKMDAARKSAEKACDEWRRLHAQAEEAERSARDYGSCVAWAAACYQQALRADLAAGTLADVAV